MSNSSSIPRERLEMPVYKWNKMEDYTMSAQLLRLLRSFHAQFLFCSGITLQNANPLFADPEAYSYTK